MGHCLQTAKLGNIFMAKGLDSSVCRFILCIVRYFQIPSCVQCLITQSLINLEGADELVPQTGFIIK